MNKFLFIVCVCCLMSGCATVNQMAIDKTATKVDVSARSILILTLDLSHQDSTHYVPRAKVIFTELPNANSKEERQNFKIDEDGMISVEVGKTAHNTYVLRMALAPGKYQIKGIFGDDGSFPFHGFFFLPLIMDIDVPRNAVVYMGRLEAVLRPRQENEFRAGSVIPLIDQAVTGVSNGTFDVVVKDASETDLPMISATFPAIASADVQKILLPAFDRPKVQQWWDGNNKSSEPPATAPQTEANVNAAPTKAQ